MKTHGPPPVLPKSDGIVEASRSDFVCGRRQAMPMALASAAGEGPPCARSMPYTPGRRAVWEAPRRNGSAADFEAGDL